MPVTLRPLALDDVHAVHDWARLPEACRYQAWGLLTVDLLLAGDELIDVFRTRMTVPWRGRTIYVVTREGLATMKRLAGRPRDLADLAMLEGTDDEET